MKLNPYVSVDDTPFSATQHDVIAARGEPEKRLRNSVGLNELDYGDVVFRFQDSGRLEEVTKLAPVVIIDGEVVLFLSLAEFMRNNDSSAFERGGFIVSPRFGLAFDPQCPSWVTALARHCIDTWRALS
jgi:hypothetical protein